MQKMKSMLMLVLWLTSGNLLAQVGQQRVDAKETASLDAEREKHALQVLAKLTEKVIVSAADAMPADKYGFAPTDGEFKGVRTFGQMAKHLSATNYILAVAALGEEPPADASDELGPEAVRTKAEIRSEEHTSELQSRQYLVCRLLLEKKKYEYPPIPLACRSQPRSVTLRA